jgi:hypothetical protein
MVDKKSIPRLEINKMLEGIIGDNAYANTKE